MKLRRRHPRPQTIQDNLYQEIAALQQLAEAVQLLVERYPTIERVALFEALHAHGSELLAVGLVFV